MDIQLTPRASQLVQTIQLRSHEPVEQIIEHALEALARQNHIELQSTTTAEAQHRAVSEMFDFIKQNRVQLEEGLFVKDLIHEGHRS